ncbi:MAG: FmdB family zinc ribbon protein [Solirubrobacterales bacterium]
MPIYEYRCANGHVFDVTQSMSDDPVEACEQCGAPVERVFHPVAVHFKGSGFYSTDYAAKSKAGASSDSDSPDSSGAAKGDKADSKADSKAESNSGSGSSSAASDD